MYLIKKIGDKNYQIKSTDTDTIIGYAETPEVAEKICEDWCKDDWGWE